MTINTARIEHHTRRVTNKPPGSSTMANSDYPNHIVLAYDLQAYLRWRNLNNRHPDVLAAQRRERTRARSERHQRWGRPRPRAEALPQTAWPTRDSFEAAAPQRGVRFAALPVP